MGSEIEFVLSATKNWDACVFLLAGVQWNCFAVTCSINKSKLARRVVLLVQSSFIRTQGALHVDAKNDAEWRDTDARKESSAVLQYPSNRCLRLHRSCIESAESGTGTGNSDVTSYWPTFVSASTLSLTPVPIKVRQLVCRCIDIDVKI